MLELPRRCEYIRKFRHELEQRNLISKETSVTLWMLTIKCAKKIINENQNKIIKKNET